ncbi:low affinity immunoglobulin epsilon Fc receptor-like, partial [Silurus asotus]
CYDRMRISTTFLVFPDKLILIKKNLTWKEALRYCRNHHHDLVSVDSEEMQLWVKGVAQSASTKHVWLGLRHSCTVDFWYWVNFQFIYYQDWAPGNGTGHEDCSNEERSGTVQSGGTPQQWVSLPQSNTLNFICSNYDC